MKDLAGKVAVVTGGGSGIGRGISLGLAAEKMTVAVADVRAESAEAVAAEITERGATRMDDQTSEASMEKRKKEGYF